MGDGHGGAAEAAAGQADSATSTTVATTSGVTERRRQKPVGLLQRGVWFLSVHWHRLRAAMKTWSWWFNNLVFLGLMTSIGWPILVQQNTRSLAYIALLVGMKIGLVRRLSTPRAMQLVARGYLERKTLLFKLVLLAGRNQKLTDDRAREYQSDVLHLIAEYVRCHREDHRGTEIFANLLVEDGSEVVVVARDRRHRKPDARYPRDKTLIGYTLGTGDSCYTGDVRAEFGVDRTYKSVLVLPVHNGSRILGAVSIDSTRAHHFDIEHNDLERYLAPYVALLAWTLERRNPHPEDPGANQ